MRILLIYGEVLIESKSNREKNYMRKNIREIERKIITLYEKKSLLSAHFETLGTWEQPCHFGMYCIQSHFLCCGDVCLFKISTFEWGNTGCKFDLAQNYWLGLKISANQFLRAKCRPRAITRSQVSAQIPAAIFQSLVRDREQILKICVGMIGPIKGGV